MVQRVTYRRQTPYNTRSNRVRIVKTPGNTLRYQHLKKLGSAPKCGDCGIALPGIPALRPREYSNISKPKKTVQRAYGGSRCANCVHDRVIRAFLIEEQQVRIISDSRSHGSWKSKFIVEYSHCLDCEGSFASTSQEINHRITYGEEVVIQGRIGMTLELSDHINLQYFP